MPGEQIPAAFFSANQKARLNDLGVRFLQELDVSLWEAEGRALNEALPGWTAENRKFHLHVPMDTVWTLQGESGVLGVAELHLQEGVKVTAAVRLQHYTLTLEGVVAEEAQWRTELRREGRLLAWEEESTEGFRVRRYERKDTDGNPYTFVAVDAARVYVEESLMDEAFLRGWWEERLWDSLTGGWMPDTPQSQAYAWVQELDRGTQLELFYPEYENQAAARLYPAVLLRETPEEQMWTWELRWLFADGFDVQAGALLEDTRFYDFATALRQLRQQVTEIIPNLFYL